MGGERGAKVGTGHVEIVADLTKFRSQVERSFRRGQLRKQITGELTAMERTVGDKLGAIGDKMSSAGAALTKGLTLPILAVGGASLKLAVDFETAFAGVRKTVNDLDEQGFGKLEQGLRDLGRETGTMPANLAAIAEAAGALGIAGDDILGFVETVNKLDVATDLDAGGAATALGKLKNVLDLPVEELENLSSAIVDLGNKGASTEPEIVDLALRIAASGKNAGLSTPEILAYAAAVADAGIQAEAGGTAISQTFGDVARAVATGKDLKDFARVAGESASDFARDFREKPAQAIAAFIDGLQRINKEAGPGGVLLTLDELGIKGERQVRVLQTLANAQEGVTDKIRTATDAWRDNTAAQSEFEKFMATSQKRLDKIKVAFADAGISLGEALLPAIERVVDSGALTSIADSIASLAEGFSKLPPGVQDALVKTAAALVVAGPALRILGPVFKGLGSLATTLKAARTAEEIALIGSSAKTAGGRVGGLSGKLKGLKALGVIGVGVVVSIVEEKVGGENPTVPGQEPKGAAGILDDLGLNRFGKNSVTASMESRMAELKRIAERWGPEVSKAVGEAFGIMSPYWEGLSGSDRQRILANTSALVGVANEAIKAGLDPTETADAVLDAADLILAGWDGVEAKLAVVAGKTGLHFEELGDGAKDAASKVTSAMTDAAGGIGEFGDQLEDEVTKSLGHWQTFEDGTKAFVVETNRGWVQLGQGFNNFVGGMRNGTGEIVGMFQDAQGFVVAFVRTATGEIEKINLDPLVGDIESLMNTLGITEDQARELSGWLDRVARDRNAKVTVTFQKRGDLGVPLADGGPIDVFHGGGFIPSMHSGGLRPDERFIKAQAGEYMIQKSAVAALGVRFLERLNAGDLSAFEPDDSRPPIVVDLHNTIELDGKVVARQTVKHTSRELNNRFLARGRKR